MIVLDENYTVTNDSNSWTLHYEKDTGKVSEAPKSLGKPIISRNQWYYSNLNACLVKYSDEVLKVCSDVKQVLIMLSELKEELWKKGKE